MEHLVSNISVMYHELARKGAHTLLAIVLLYIGVHTSPQTVLLGAGILCVVAVASRFISYFQLFHAVSRTSYGEFFFCLGTETSALLFLPQNTVAWQIGMLTLAFADPLAALVGRRLGTHTYHLWMELRSIEGSVACTATVATIFILFNYSIPVSILAGMLLALIEASAPRGSDNFVLPVAAGAFAMLLA